MGCRRLSRRRLLQIAPLVLAGAGLAACAGAPPAAALTAQESAAATPPQAGGERVTIRWQDWPDWEPKIDVILAEMERQLPHIKVEFEPLGGGLRGQDPCRHGGRYGPRCDDRLGAHIPRLGGKGAAS